MSSKLPLRVMDTLSVSKSYYIALSMVHDLTTELYDRVHDDNGDPILDEAFLYDVIQEYKKIARGELDMIKTAARQYNESEG